jgi:hypothetical protein
LARFDILNPLSIRPITRAATIAFCALVVVQLCALPPEHVHTDQDAAGGHALIHRHSSSPVISPLVATPHPDAVWTDTDHTRVQWLSVTFVRSTVFVVHPEVATVAATSLSPPSAYVALTAALITAGRSHGPPRTPTPPRAPPVSIARTL